MQLCQDSVLGTLVGVDSQTMHRSGWVLARAKLHRRLLKPLLHVPDHLGIRCIAHEVSRT